ncbi:MAG TPA: MarR family transcriptional regulator [Candidatus Limisoma gallistercoris]|jgi:DNA-binding MarR family transcriptional regulator|nr:MarR family transcriptional regulator [Candidatus Limisoma gallistercoris]
MANDEEMLCKIRDLQRSIAQFESAFEKRYGISLNEGMVLCSLKKSSKLSAAELGNLLGLTHSNTSKVIKSVESKGYILRTIGNYDKRQMYFSLTDQGKQIIASVKCDMTGMPEILSRIIR